ncbi:substrate-binding periplasmic protein [Roseburia porci]|uniref:substrate-binding periplasmic protein n=1 Tax=Roseburia porci TaxID=2605790 RepID=UPI002E2641F9
MKKKICVLIFMVLCIFALAGCGKSSAGTKKVTSVDELSGAKIGVQLGTTADIYASDYEGDDAGTTVERYNKMADAVQALKQDKIDCVIIDEQPAIAVTKDSDDLKILDEEFTSEDYAICIAKGNDQLREKINGALAELKEDGTIEQILSNYIGEDAGKHPYETPQGTTYDNGTLVVATNATFPPYE